MISTIRIIRSPVAKNEIDTSKHQILNTINESLTSPSINRFLSESLLQHDLQKQDQQQHHNLSALMQESYYHVRVVQKKLVYKRKNNWPKYINRLQMLSHSLSQSIEELKAQNSLKEFLLPEYSANMKHLAETMVGSMVEEIKVMIREWLGKEENTQQSYQTKQIIEEIVNNKLFSHSQPTTNQHLYQLNQTIQHLKQSLSHNQTHLNSSSTPEINSQYHPKLLLTYKLAKTYYSKGLLPRATKSLSSSLVAIDQLNVGPILAQLLSLIVHFFKLVIYLRMNSASKVLQTHQMIIAIINELITMQNNSNLSIANLHEHYLLAIPHLTYKIHTRAQTLNSFHQTLSLILNNRNQSLTHPTLPRPYLTLKLQATISYLQKDYAASGSKITQAINMLLADIPQEKDEKAKNSMLQQLNMFCDSLILSGLYSMALQVSTFILISVQFRFANQFNQKQLYDELYQQLKIKNPSAPKPHNHKSESSIQIQQQELQPAVPAKYQSQHFTQTAKLIAESAYNLAFCHHQLEHYTKSLKYLKIYHTFIASQQNPKIIPNPYSRTMPFYEIDTKVFSTDSKIRKMPSVPACHQLGKIKSFVLETVSYALVRMERVKDKRLINFLYFYAVLNLEEIVFQWEKVKRVLKITNTIEKTLKKYQKLFSSAQKPINNHSLTADERIVKKSISYIKRLCYPKCLITDQDQQQSSTIKNSVYHQYSYPGSNDHSVDRSFLDYAKPKQSLLQNFIMKQLPKIKARRWKSYKELEDILGQVTNQTEVLMYVKGVMHMKKGQLANARKQREQSSQPQEDYFTDICLKLQASNKTYDMIVNNIQPEIRFLPPHAQKYLVELDKRTNQLWRNP